MTRKEYIDQLRQALERHKIRDLEEVISDYEEHFAHGMKSGQTESQISEKLGSPWTIAKAYEAESLIEKIKSTGAQPRWVPTLQALGRLLIIAPFNFLVFFIPGVLIFAGLVTGWSLVLAVGSVCFAIMGLSWSIGVIGLSFWAITTLVAATLGFVGLAIFFGLVMYQFTKYILLGIIHYLQWNLKFILEK